MDTRHFSMRSGHRDRTVSQDTSSRDSYLDDDLLGERRGRHSPVSEITPEHSDHGMPDLTNLSFEDPEGTLIVAIDYGTTNTGVAWCYSSTAQVKLNEIKPIRMWAVSGYMSNMSKVPSVYSYSLPDAGELQWGADLSRNAVTMINTKLELDLLPRLRDELDLTLQLLDGTKNLSFENIKKTGDEPEYTWKSPEAVVTDYMYEICEAVYPSLGRYSQDETLRAGIPVDLVVTVPVNWSYQARNSTLRAITKAGFNEKKFPLLRNVIMVSEPEAAALYTARFYREIKRADFLKAHECFILCDAGGGTVDCVSYQVTQLEPHLELRKATKSTSEKCGATYINESFKRWLRGLIGDKHYRYLDPNISELQSNSQTTESGALRELMVQFEVEKRRYPHRNQAPSFKLSLPHPLNTLSITGKVKDGDITITMDQMRKFFDPYVSKVITLIVGQIQQIKEIERRPKNVILVGGFGESPYLRQQLEISLPKRKLTLRRPDQDTAWIAVVCGAAMYGVEQTHYSTLRLMHQSRRSYGIVINEVAPVWKLNEGNHYTDLSNNTVMVADQFAWLVRKGDLIMSDEALKAEKDFTATFLENATRAFDLPLYAYPADEDETNDDVPDTWQTGKHEVDPVGVVNCNMTRFRTEELTQYQDHLTGQKSFTANLVCKMQMTLDTMLVEVFFNNVSVGQSTIMVDNVHPDM